MIIGCVFTDKREIIVNGIEVRSLNEEEIYQSNRV